MDAVTQCTVDMGLVLFVAAFVRYHFEVPMLCLAYSSLNPVVLLPITLDTFIHRLFSLSHIDDERVIFTALIYLERLKARYPRALGRSGHPLILAALALASKNARDRQGSFSRSRAWWSFQDVFRKEAVDAQETELLRLLDFCVDVDDEEFAAFYERMTECRRNGGAFTIPEDLYEAAPGGLPDGTTLLYIPRSSPTPSTPALGPAFVPPSYGLFQMHLLPPYPLDPDADDDSDDSDDGDDNAMSSEDGDVDMEMEM